MFFRKRSADPLKTNVPENSRDRKREFDKYLKIARDYFSEACKNQLMLEIPNKHDFKFKFIPDQNPSLSIPLSELKREISDEVYSRIADGEHVIQDKRANRLHVSGGIFVSKDSDKIIPYTFKILSEIYRDIMIKNRILDQANEQNLHPLFGYAGMVEGYLLILPIFANRPLVIDTERSSTYNYIPDGYKFMLSLTPRKLIGSTKVGEIKSIGSIGSYEFTDPLTKSKKIMIHDFTVLPIQGGLSFDNYDYQYGKTKRGFIIKSRDRLIIYDRRLNPDSSVVIPSPDRTININIDRHKMYIRWVGEDPILLKDAYDF
ncbi:MAG: hypothetical protein QXL02_01045 [Candidatus Anstonellales archaeon]